MKKIKIAFAEGDQRNIRLTKQTFTPKKLSKAVSKPQQGGKHENYIIRGGDLKKTELHLSGTNHEWHDGHFRLDKNLLSACLLVLDLDAKSSNVLLPKEEQTAEPISKVSAMLELLGYNHFGYTTHSHQPDKGIHKSRVFVPCELSSQSQLEPSVCKLVEELQKKGVDVIVNPEMLRWSQCWYLPTRDDPKDGFFEHCEYLEGRDFEAIDEGDYVIPASAKSSAYKGKSNREMRKDIKSGAHLHGPINNMIMQQAKEFVKRKTTLGKITTMAEKLFKLSPLKNDNPTYWKNEYDRLKENIDGAIRRAKQDKLDSKSKPTIKTGKSKRISMPVIPDELIFPPDKYGEFIRSVMNSTQHRNNPVAAMVHGN